MDVLVKAESYLMGDGRREKLNRKTSAYLGGNGAGGAMCQARIVRAEWIIRPRGGN